MLYPNKYSGTTYLGTLPTNFGSNPPTSTHPWVLPLFPVQGVIGWQTGKGASADEWLGEAEYDGAYMSHFFVLILQLAAFSQTLPVKDRAWPDSSPIPRPPLTL